MAFYGSAVGFITYTKDRGRSISPVWTYSVIEAALLVSSEWLDNRYGEIWVGHPTDGFTQSRKWPRTSAVTNTFPQHTFSNSEIPDVVVNAIYEATYRELVTNGTLEKDYTPNKYTKVSVDGAVSVEYDNSLRASDIQIQIPIIESLMQPLLNSSAQGSFSLFSGGLSRV